MQASTLIAYHGNLDDEDKPDGWGDALYHQARYRGEWRHGFFHGQGELMLTSGTSYSGEFEVGKMHGRGVMYFSDGRVYDGSAVRGKLEGTARITLSAGGVYTGETVKGRAHGAGEMVFPNGDRYTGEWQAGVMHGKGRLEQVADDNIYEGSWEDDRRDGRFFLTKRSGSTYQVDYKEDVLVDSQKVKRSTFFKNMSMFKSPTNKNGVSPKGSPVGAITPNNPRFGSITSGNSFVDTPRSLARSASFAGSFASPMRNGSSVCAPGSPRGNNKSASFASNPEGSFALNSPDAPDSTKAGTAERVKAKLSRKELEAVEEKLGGMKARRVKSLHDFGLAKETDEVGEEDAMKEKDREARMRHKSRVIPNLRNVQTSLRSPQAASLTPRSAALGSPRSLGSPRHLPPPPPVPLGDLPQPITQEEETSQLVTRVASMRMSPKPTPRDDGTPLPPPPPELSLDDLGPSNDTFSPINRTQSFANQVKMLDSGHLRGVSRSPLVSMSPRGTPSPMPPRPKSSLQV